MKAPEVTLPVRRKERSLSSLVVDTPRVSTQTAMTRRRSKAVARKASALRGSSFPIEKPAKKEEDSSEDREETLSSPETLNKFTQNIRQVKETTKSFLDACSKHSLFRLPMPSVIIWPYNNGAYDYIDNFF